MGEVTGISWCDSTWNPWIGCTKVSPGCDHCYASVSTPARAMHIEWGPGHLRHRTAALNWGNPLRWNARPFYRCLACGWRGSGPLVIAHKPPNFHPPVEWATRCPACNEPTITEARRRVFCGSLCDVFDNEVPPEWRADLFDLIANTPRLDWLLLTKRIGNAEDMMNRALLDDGPDWPWDNLWLGATVVNQEEANRDIPKLLATPAAKRFVSYEPALGPVDWSALFAANDLHKIDGGPRIDWIIVGGESDQPGMRARPFDIGWARSTIEQCRDAGVACFVKQLGARPIRYECGMRERCTHPDCGPRSVTLRDRAGANPAEWPEDLRVREFPR